MRYNNSIYYTIAFVIVTLFRKELLMNDEKELIELCDTEELTGIVDEMVVLAVGFGCGGACKDTWGVGCGTIC